MSEKICSKCRIVKPLTEFYDRGDKRGISKKTSHCKSCFCESVSKSTDRSKKHEYNRNYFAQNRDKFRSNRAKYKAQKVLATPSWAVKHKIDEYYFAADFLGMVTGEWYEVDHIVPLLNEKVCGLHVEHNLQVITREENRRKSNKWLD